MFASCVLHRVNGVLQLQSYEFLGGEIVVRLPIEVSSSFSCSHWQVYCRHVKAACYCCWRL